MKAEFEVGTMLAPSRPSNRAWRRGLVVGSIGVAGLLVGIGASELVDGSSDSATTFVETEASPGATTAGDPGPAPDPLLWKFGPRSSDRPQGQGPLMLRREER